MKIALITDTHFGARNDSLPFNEYFYKFWEDIFFPYIDKHNINTIIHLGDTMDRRKFVSYKIANDFRRRFIVPIVDRNIDTHILIGNHDTYYKNTNELNSLKECLGHYMNEVHIIMEPTVMKYGSLSMGLLPWICPDNYEQSMNFIKDCKADWLGAHLELNGFEFALGIKSTHGMDAKLFSKFEQVISGHFHTASQQGNIWYLGNPMEFFWSDAHDPKYFHILDTETREIEKIRNNYTLFEKIVYNDKEIDYNNYNKNLSKKFVKVVVAEKTDPFTFDRFIDRIQNQDIYELKIAENFNEFMGANVDDEDMNFEDTTEIVDSYIEAVDTDLDKDKIKIQMRELMTEAQALEIA